MVNIYKKGMKTTSYYKTMQKSSILYYKTGSKESDNTQSAFPTLRIIGTPAGYLLYFTV